MQTTTINQANNNNIYVWTDECRQSKRKSNKKLNLKKCHRHIPTETVIIDNKSTK